MANNLTVGYLPQQPEFAYDDTVIKAVTKDIKTEENQWTIESDVKSMLTRMGIYDFDEICGHLSGGQKKRLALVSLLLSKPDLLLLDEPTNHLDSEMSQWLEDELNSYRGALIMITHDRYFLDRVVNRIIEIDKGKIYSYEENYSGFLELKALREDMEDAAERKRQSILRVELEWVKRGARARSTKQKARLNRYEELKNQNAPVRDDKVLMSSVSSRLGRTTVILNDICKSYGDKRIINNFTYNFLRNDRVGFIGKNGCGKSTLMKIIMGMEKPDSGTGEIGSTVNIGYFAQEIADIKSMKPEQRVIDYIRDEAEYVETPEGKITATRLLERFLFKGEDQYGLIGKLSGGEKRRLYLCRILMSAPNVLILDEPTNDLDISTLMILEDYLDSFDGIVIVVSHDRYFLDRVVRRIFYYTPGGVLKQSEGGYSDYELRLEYEKSEAADRLSNGSGYSNNMNNSKKLSSSGNSDLSKAASAADKEGVSSKGKPREKKLKFTYNEQKEYETIEDDIIEIEEKIAELEQEILDNSRDFEKLQKLSNEKTELEVKLSEKMDRWVYLEELKAAIEAQ